MSTSLAEPRTGGPLFWPDAPGDTLTIRGARVVDPVGGIDGPHDITIEDGVIASVEPTAHDSAATECASAARISAVDVAPGSWWPMLRSPRYDARPFCACSGTVARIPSSPAA